MTVSLTLPPDVEARVYAEAARRSVAVDDYVASVITAAVPAADSERRARALAAIEAVNEMGTEEEQQDTFDFLSRAIDEDRLSDRKLFS